MRDAGGVGTAVPALGLLPPLAEGAEQGHSCACTEAEFVLLNGQPLTQGTPGLFKGTLEREVPPRGVPVWSRSEPLLGVPESSQLF